MAITKIANITANAREIDFVTRFASNWQALAEIIGISRPIRKTPGTTLVSYTASISLENSVAEGEVIPFSTASVVEAAKSDLTIEKYAKAVSIEAVSKYGAAVAVQKTDEAFLSQLQSNVMDRFYTFLGTGTLTDTATSFQEGVAKSIGLVRNKFKSMHKDITNVVTFVNILDAYEYLGAANLTVQTAFGIDYIEKFMGATIIMTSEIESGTIISTPVDNMVAYYIDPADSEFGQLGLDYTVSGDTNLIGFHVEGEYDRAIGAVYALMGFTLWAEYLDGISVVSVNSGE